MNEKRTPPKLPLRFFRWFCHPDYREDIEGDLLERFNTNARDKSTTKAKIKYTLDVLRLFRPGLLRGFSFAQKLTQMDIFRNYFKTTYRNAKREKAFSILTILCLTIGFTASIYVTLYTKHEFSYDKFHEKADRIYRINQTFIWGQVDELFGSTGPAVMGAIQAEVPEFETMTRVCAYSDALITISSTKEEFTFEEGQLRAADSTFFDVFTFPLIKGNPASALDEPYSVVLTESTAKKYFGTTDVLGEQIQIEDEDHNHSYLVTGVAKDIPANSHVTFDLLVSMSSIQRLKWAHDTWWWTTFVTFGVLRPDADPELVAKKVAQVPGKYLEPFLMKYRDMTYAEFQESGETWDLFMQPLLDIHLSGGKVFSRLNETSDIQTIIILDTIAGLILLLSIINFVNLTTAQSSRRSKEIGVRKIIGTSRSSITYQFLFESLVFCSISVGVSIILLRTLSPYFEVVSGKMIPLELIFKPDMIIVLIVGTLIISTLAGIYPAMFLSSTEPIKVIKGQLSSGKRGNFIRRLLVTVQFTVSIALIACSMIIHNQVQYWLNMDLGFTKDDILVIQNVERLDNSIKSFQSQIEESSVIRKSTFSSDSPPYIGHTDEAFSLNGKEDIPISFLTADENFSGIYGLKMIAGKDFNPSENNRDNVIISRSMTEAFDFSDPGQSIGQRIKYYDLDKQIIGVFEDIESEIRWQQLPIAIFYEKDLNEKVEYMGPYRQMSLQLKPDLSGTEISELLTALQEDWSSFSTLPLKFYFQDQQFREIFEPTIKFGKLINLYAVIATIIAGLGLVGLVAYVIERRNKEIGIRKVLGASVSSVILLLTSEFGKLLIIGFVVSTPVTWVIMKNWQADFQYQDKITPLTFLVAGSVMILVAGFTLGYQTLKAARSNPVKYLRDE